MGENIKELLNEEIAAEIQAISSLDSGSEEKSRATALRPLLEFVRNSGWLSRNPGALCPVKTKCLIRLLKDGIQRIR